MSSGGDGGVGDGGARAKLGWPGNVADHDCGRTTLVVLVVLS